MAKGLRSSTKKSNRTALRSKVFEPVENARLERIHQKMLETAQQPKPENPKKNEMELDAPEGTAAHKTLHHPHHCENHSRMFADLFPLEANDSNEDDFPKGSSRRLTAAIPPSLLSPHATSTTSTSTSTDTTTSTLQPSSSFPPSSDKNADSRMSQALYHLLGLSSDILGFTPDGQLELAFASLPS